MKLIINDEFNFKIKKILKKTFFYTLLMSGFMYGAKKSGDEYYKAHPELAYHTIEENVDKDIEDVTPNVENEVDELIKEMSIIEDIENDSNALENDIPKEDNRMVVALTFDDGPGKYTDRLLDILKENNVKATFFVLGKNVLKYPEVVKRAYDEGHEICIHGYDHQYYTNLGIEETRNQIVQTYNILREIDVEPQPYVRPPGGKHSKELVENTNYAYFLWSVDTRDWQSRDKDKIISIINRDITNGAIILQHDVHECSVDATEEYLPILTSNYKFVTISELFNELDNDLEINNIYRKAKVKEKQLSK